MNRRVLFDMPNCQGRALSREGNIYCVVEVDEID
jgi:hypothetical protein